MEMRRFSQESGRLNIIMDPYWQNLIGLAHDEKALTNLSKQWMGPQEGNRTYRICKLAQPSLPLSQCGGQRQ